MANRRSTARDLAQIAVFAALIAALGLPGKILVGASAVPITFQTLGVMLAGAILGARKGFLAVLTFDVLTFAGLPLLAGPRGGPAPFTSSVSAGFLYGWLLGVVVIGFLTSAIMPKYPLWAGILATAAGGMVLIYAVGIPWWAMRGHFSLSYVTSLNLIFLPGDSVKVVITALVAKQVHRAYPGLIRPRASKRAVVAAPSTSVGPADLSDKLPERSGESQGTTPLG
ncbi:biotin transport system substrate-specific component [Nakamurella sp. UYEF19]|uniref:biotin transporter BioY n=1 Tax=Nakamurella sp. UYEF19 TaxID=1756392 RepID=UPI003398B7CE